MRRAILGLLILLIPAHAAAQRVDRWVEPQATDPAIDDWLDPHFVSINRTVPPRDLLLVFFPGSGALPSYYTRFVQTAADAGFHAVGLCYPNSWSVNFNLCGFSSDPNCHADVRFEILEGVDVSPLPEVKITPTNCIRNRLGKLIEHQAATYPDENWQQFLAGSEPRWDRIACAGHSQGGGHAAFVAKWYDVWRVLMFAGGTDLFFGQPDPYAAWLDDHLTPAVDYWGFVHLQDSPSAYLGAWDIIGLDDFGDPLLADDRDPPYEHRHQLVTNIPSPVPDKQHSAIIVDDFLPLDGNGQPVYLPVWHYLLNTTVPPGNIDADTDVDMRDLARLQASFGRCAGEAAFDAPTDVDFDACVTIADAGTTTSHLEGPE